MSPTTDRGLVRDGPRGPARAAVSRSSNSRNHGGPGIFGPLFTFYFRRSIAASGTNCLSRSQENAYKCAYPRAALRFPDYDAALAEKMRKPRDD